MSIPIWPLVRFAATSVPGTITGLGEWESMSCLSSSLSTTSFSIRQLAIAVKASLRVSRMWRTLSRASRRIRVDFAVDLPAQLCSLW